MKILIIDDEVNILSYYEKVLSKEGYQILKALSGEKALDIYYDNPVDLIIIDEMMPIISGNEVIKEIRSENKQIPIIMATAKSSIEDKGYSYDLGIDDYLVKPINGTELIMHIKALIRRAKINTDKKIIVGATCLDSETHTITNSITNTKVLLTKKEFEILYKLLLFSEKAFTKWQLFDEFWGINSDTDESIVKVFILKIRKKIEVFPEIGIETIMGVGYKGIKNE